ncbi:hypothetical protein O7632_25630 [Solwaraspora sp. WMMD406]|nr:hypothetical protein [Solwaraspora sp. WMMD406]MDG4767445.1 hypothetical protein [Solwaraspora sp. WMMD406]
MTALLFLFYFLVMTPVGWLARIGPDPMRRRWRRQADSYWTPSRVDHE